MGSEVACQFVDACSKEPILQYTCNRAKPTKPPSYKKGGSETVVADKFGDHLTADHLILRDDGEEDNAEELVKAATELRWRQVTRAPYISKTNAQAERNIRSVLGGTRINLEQAGLHHNYWNIAAWRTTSSVSRKLKHRAQ